MKTSTWGCRALATAALLALGASTAGAASQVTLVATPSGDAGYAWNTKYGPSGYTQGDTTLGVMLQMNAPYGNDIAAGLIEIPIGALQGGDLLSAQLVVNTTGFGTSYWYGSAGMAWLDVGSRILTGDVVADGLGVLAAPAITWTLWNSDGSAGPGDPTQKIIDVTSVVQQDLAAGRSYSSFMLTGSRDTWGGIYAAESGIGARLLATTTAPVPEPATWFTLMAGLGCVGLLARRRGTVA